MNYSLFENIKSITLIILIVLFSFTSNQVQALNPEETAIKKLFAAGYDAISIKILNNELLCVVESGNYRSKSEDIKQVYIILQSIYNNTINYKIILTELGQPIYQFTSNSTIDTLITDKNINLKSNINSNIDYYNYADYKIIRDESITRNNNKIIWLFMYPQIEYRNNTIDPIYEKQINFAPTIKYNAWKGMLFTGQIIFPIINDLEYHNDFIRPGFVTFSQKILFKHNIDIEITAGNFNKNRYGFDLKLNKNIRNSMFNFTANMGYTGQIFIYDRYINRKPLNTLSYNIKVSYYYPKLQIQTVLQAGQFLYNDKGFRADVYRHFGETTIGLYAYYSGNNWNGGFNYAIPIGPKKRKNSGNLRVVLPSHFDSEYNYKSDATYGRFYETKPDDNRSTQNLHSKYIQNLFINP